MKNRIFLIVLLFSFSLFGQLAHETRAVWVATNFGLDFPHGIRDAESQKILLRRIFKDIKEKNYNTVYFQVRANGTTFFNSEYEPYSAELTGRTGSIPAYDPAQLSIDLAREFGLEIHAWVNTFRCFSGNDREPLLDKKHPVTAREDLVVPFYEGETLAYWMDPGNPDTHTYLVELFSDLTTKYNFDGLQLDFIRYPGKSFNDGTTFSRYGERRDKAEWRRDNITRFIKSLSQKVKLQNPYLKLGTTPIGIYKNPPGVYGFEAFNDVYQDVESWINNGIIDYVIPQIYWDINSNPRFEVIAKDWLKMKGNVQIILGIGAYKPEVKSEITSQIAISRKLGAEGIAMFRYRNISDINLFSDPALPATYNTIAIEPLPLPFNLSAGADKLMNNNLKLSWQYDSENEQKLKYFVLYEVQDGVPLLLKLVDPADRASYLISARKVKEVGYYTVGTVDLNWNENYDASNLIRVENKLLKNLLGKIGNSETPLLQKRDNNFLLNLYSEGDERLDISIKTQSANATTYNIKLKKGLNLITLPLVEGAQEMKLDFIERKQKRSLRL
ncbi:MAG: hypothetical protein SCALA702_14610 [Melioribacteraceae bacterium]|nr:MAG: hypothetical protein SCALA702_14610 [Melioribacteraceae bacterium]